MSPLGRDRPVLDRPILARSRSWLRRMASSAALAVRRRDVVAPAAAIARPRRCADARAGLVDASAEERERRASASASQNTASRLSTSSWNRSSSESRRALPSASEVMSAIPRASRMSPSVERARGVVARSSRSRRTRRAPSGAARRAPGRGLVDDPELAGHLLDELDLRARRARSRSAAWLSRELGRHLADLGAGTSELRFVHGVEARRAGSRPSPRRARTRPPPRRPPTTGSFRAPPGRCRRRSCLLGQRLRERQQRRRGSRRLALLAQHRGVLERDRGMRGQHLQQALVLIVELAVAQARQHDHADDASPISIGHQEHRLDDVVGALDLDRELDLLGVGREQRDAGVRRPSPVIPSPTSVTSSSRVSSSYSWKISPRNAIGSRVSTVGLQQVHAAVVVVDDRAELVGDGRADLLHAAHGVQGGGQAVQHVELGHRAEALGRSWCRHHVHPLTGCC